MKACAESFRKQKLPLHVLVRDCADAAASQSLLLASTLPRTAFPHSAPAAMRPQINNAGSSLYGATPFYTKEGVGGSAMVCAQPPPPSE